ncbi:MAG: glutathione S-transferase family protein [Hyphomicrobiaceae bacterium]
MTYKLYNRTGSGGFAVEAALTLAGQAFELITIESVPSTPLPESFREINPWRQVPVLVLPDGSKMTETGAMLIYIATRYPGIDVGPEPGTPAAAQLMRWVVFLSANVYEATIRRAYPERYTTDAAGADGVRAAAVRRNDAAFALLGDQLAASGFLAGADMSAADVYLAMLYAWHPGEKNAACVALTHKVAAHEAIAPLWQRNFDHRLKVKWGRDVG